MATDVRNRIEVQPSLARFFGVFSAAMFASNWAWEIIQSRAYAAAPGLPWGKTVITCTIATVGDVALGLGIYGVAALAAGQLRWGISGGWNVYAASAVLGAVSAIAIESWALLHAQWTYDAAMPVLPLIEVGLWPFLQLTLLIPAALWIARRDHRRRSSSAPAPRG